MNRKRTKGLLSLNLHIMHDLKTIQNTLPKADLDAWVLITSENKDPYFSKYISSKTNVLSIAIITPNDSVIFVHGLDIDNLIDDKPDIRIVELSSKNSILELIGEYFISHPKIKRVGLNYSTINDVQIDTLGHGYYTYFTDEIIKRVTGFTLDNFVSAEILIYSLVDQKTNIEIERLKVAANRANNILEKAFKEIRIGMTEKDLLELVHEITNRKPVDYITNDSVVGEEYSWSENACPIILTGENFIKGGHAGASNKVIEEGSTVYIDFGVKLHFKDGSSYSSDIQRTAYVLKKNEEKAPQDISDRFDAIIQSISEGIEKIKPGMKGCEADIIVRDFLKNKGYPNYNHATGHAIGEHCHNPGTLISALKKGRSALEIQPNGVYTLEPRIPVPNGVSIEEMVVFYPDKPAEALCPRQLEPILIRLNP